jgi:hypothetical protein
MQRPDPRLWLVTILIVLIIAGLVAFDWRDNDAAECFPAPACRSIPVDELR